MVPQAAATLADVGVADQIERVFADLANLHDRLNVLVNNADIATGNEMIEQGHVRGAVILNID